MPVTITVRDETPAGKPVHERPLEIPTERITVRELIRERVYQEVQDFNRARDAKLFHGLVQPTDAEQVLNGAQVAYRVSKRMIDWKQQFDLATHAFQSNGFLILVGDRQAERLDDEFVVTAGTDVAFVKLTPLVGG